MEVDQSGGQGETPPVVADTLTCKNWLSQAEGEELVMTLQ